MTVDHVAVVFLDRGSSLYFWMRVAGRPALPIACFLLAEGFVKTSNRAKYILRIVVTAVVAELFWLYLWSMQRIEAMKNVQRLFDEAGGEAKYPGKDGLYTWFSALSSEQQTELTGWIVPILNVLFTFTICMLMLLLVKKIKDHFGDLMPNQLMKNVGYLACMGGTVMVTILFCALCPLTLDYAIEAPMIILACYLFREERKTMGIMLGVISLFMATQSIYMALATLLGVFLIFGCNGQLGYDKEKHPFVRILFYAYYPLHLAILVESRYFQEIFGNIFK